MLILPPGHAQQVATRPRFAARERWMMGGVLVLVVALAITLVVSLTTQGKVSAHGCVHVNLPYSTGGQEVYECGSRARSLCASAGQAGSFTGPAAETVAVQCRKAGLPSGRQAGR